MVAFAYLGLVGDRPRIVRFSEHGILYGANLGQFSQSGGRATDADVSISVEYDSDIETLSQRFEDSADLTDAEIEALVRAGELTGMTSMNWPSRWGFPRMFVKTGIEPGGVTLLMEGDCSYSKSVTPLFST